MERERDTERQKERERKRESGSLLSLEAFQKCLQLLIRLVITCAA